MATFPVQVTKWEFPLQLYRAQNTQMSNIKRANTALSIRRGAPCARVLAGRARPHHKEVFVATCIQMRGHQDRYEAAGEIWAFPRMASGVHLDLFTRPSFSSPMRGQRPGLLQ